MPCVFCGEGDRWIKTCRTKDVLIRAWRPLLEDSWGMDGDCTRGGGGNGPL